MALSLCRSDDCRLLLAFLGDSELSSKEFAAILFRCSPNIDGVCAHARVYAQRTIERIMAISRSPTKIQAEHFLLGQCILIGILFINLVQTSTSHAIFHCVLTTNFTFCTSQLMAPHVSCQKPIPRWHARDKQSNPHELLFSTSLAVDMAFCVTRRRCECEYVPNAFSYAVLTTKLRQNAIYFH